MFGLNNRFSYKNLTFSFQFDGRIGGVISNYIQRQTFRGGRHFATTEGAMGVSRVQDTKGVRSYVGEGVTIQPVLVDGKLVTPAINADPNGNILNYGELTFVPNTTPQFLQDYISSRYSPNGGNLIPCRGIIIA